MTQQVVCDDCGEPIDQSQPYYELNGTKLKLGTDVATGLPSGLVTVEPTVVLHYHEAHVPGYKVLAEPIDPATGKPIQEPVPVEPAGVEPAPTRSSRRR